MIYFAVMFLLLIEKIVLGEVYDSTEFDLESKLRDLLDLEPREKSLVLRADTDNEPEDELPQEHAPFERFNPTDKEPATIITDTPPSAGGSNNNYDEFVSAEELERLRKKLSEHKFMISLPGACLVIGLTMIISCYCAICLRNRIVACIDMCRPKKKNNYLNVDPESGGRRLTGAKLLKNKLSLTNKNRARSMSRDVTHAATQDSASSMLRAGAADTPPTGCYSCCKKKKRENKRKK